jgi:hypothetical protein
MLSGIGQQPAYGTNNAASNPKARSANDQTGSLSQEIVSDQAQLNDWITCVSANTPKGKAEIQTLTARINAAKQHITQLNAAKDAAATSANQPASTPSSATPAASAATHASSRQGSLVDTWA